jgi:protein SCO1
MQLIESLIINPLIPFRQFLLAQAILFALLFNHSVLSVAKAKDVSTITDPTSFYSNFENQTYTDQNNHAFNYASLSGKVNLFNFIFTQCSNVCPIQTKQLVEIKKLLPPNVNKNVQIVSVSLDPLNDTPKVLNTFAKKTGANLPSWSFITGSPESIQQLVDRLQLFGNEKQVKDAKRPNDHTTALWLIDKNGRLMQRYSANPLDVKRIAQEVEQLYKMP